MFDKVVMIHLRRRADRLAAFRSRCLEIGWPLPGPDLFDAVDGRELKLPPTAPAAELRGGMGCLVSHRTVVGRALAGGVQTLLVLEDDAVWGPDLGATLRSFLTSVPNDWLQLMLGGRHVREPLPVKPGLVKCTGTTLCHAYAVRPPGMARLLRMWDEAPAHIDHPLVAWHATAAVYAPDPFLFRQSDSPSDIKIPAPVECLSSPPKRRPCSTVHDLMPEGCRLCRLAVADPGFRSVWSEE